MEPNLAGQSETRLALGSHICWPNGTKRRNLIEEKHLCKISYKASSFASIRPINMAAKSRSCF
jgi:hypothetical protein